MQDMQQQASTNDDGEIDMPGPIKQKTEMRMQREVLEQDNIFEIEMQVESDVEGGIDIDNECIYGHLKFIQVPSYQQESSMCDQDMTKELMQQINSINIRIYKQEISGLQLNNDSELQNIVNSANNGQHKTKIKKQIVKEYEIVDGCPILDEFEHVDMDRHGDKVLQNAKKPYHIDFRMPLKGISRNLISPTQMNVCNMFSTLYFMQMVVILKSNSIKVPGKKQTRSTGGVQVIESQPIMLKFIR